MTQNTSHPNKHGQDILPLHLGDASILVFSTATCQAIQDSKIISHKLLLLPAKEISLLVLLPFSAYISHPGTFLLVVACQLTCFGTSLSSPCWGAQNWAQYSMHSVTNTKKKEQTFSRPAAYIFFNLTGGAVDVRHHKSTLLPRRPFWQSSFWGSPPPACLASAGPRCRCLPLRCTGLPTARPIVPQILPSWPQACGLPSSSHHQTSPVTKMIGKPQIWQLPQAPSGPMDKRTSSLLACSLTPSSSSTHNASV